MRSGNGGQQRLSGSGKWERDGKEGEEGGREEREKRRGGEGDGGQGRGEGSVGIFKIQNRTLLLCFDKEKLRKMTKKETHNKANVEIP